MASARLKRPMDRLGALTGQTLRLEEFAACERERERDPKRGDHLGSKEPRRQCSA